MKHLVIFLLSSSLALGIQAANTETEQLMTAVIRDNPSQVRKLLQQGLNPNTADSRGQPALHKAMRAESWGAVAELLQSPHISISARNPQGESALMLAAIKGRLDLVKALIERGADINHPGWTPLHYAASADLPESLPIAKTLIEQHAYIDAASPNGSTPLMLAAQYSSQAMVEYLLSEGADVHLRNQRGLSAVDFAKNSDRGYLEKILEKQWLAAPRKIPSW